MRETSSSSSNDSIQSVNSDKSTRFEDLVSEITSPGLCKNKNIDCVIACDKRDNYKDLEVIQAVLVGGCAFGKLCLHASKEPRKTLYSAITLTDSFAISFHKNDLLRMIEHKNRRILSDQMTFLKQIPSPEFALLSKKKLQNICEAL